MLETGTIITLEGGHYRLHAPLAESAYGVVWQASGPRGTGDVALKLVNRPQMERALPQQRARWIACADKEIAFLRSLAPWDERHIVRLLDCGLHDGLPVLALERMACDLGKHVASLRNRGMAVDLGQALDWLEQINHALAKVHQYGWRHLDLKPSNLLLDWDERTLKLADFGTNRLLAERAAHTYAGTANWQAPEQFFPADANGHVTDARTDYFALGAMFYYLVSGGLSLRFCSACGQAFREHQRDGAARLRAAHDGAIPPTLRSDEAKLFAHRIERQLAARDDDLELDEASADRRSASGAALALLRTLLAADADARPRHALHISRMIAQVRRAMRGSVVVPESALAQCSWQGEALRSAQ